MKEMESQKIQNDSFYKIFTQFVIRGKITSSEAKVEKKVRKVKIVVKKKVR